MAKLGIIPIIATSVNAGQQVIGLDKLRDKASVASYDGVTNTLTINIGAGVTEAEIVAEWDASRRAWSFIGAKVGANASSTTAARVNKFLTGTGAPTLQTYHRTKSIVVRAKGNAVSLPAVIALSNDPTSGWKVDKVATTGAAPSTQQGIPTATPTPIAAPPIVTGTKPLPGGGHITTSKLAPNAPSVAPTLPRPTPAAPKPAAPIAAAQPVTAAPLTPSAPVTTAPLKVDTKGRLTYPSRASTHHIEVDKQQRAILEIYWNKHIAGEQSVVGMVGPAGTGKTSLVADLAADKGVGMFTFDGMAASSFTDWTGTIQLTEGESVSTKFEPSSFLEVIRKDGDYGNDVRIVLIDELNRAETGGALNALMPILAQGHITIPEMRETIYVSQSVFFAFTMNRGSQYNSTLQLDTALADRIQANIRLDFLKKDKEVALLMSRAGIGKPDAEKLVDTAQQIRDIADRGEVTSSISTRRTLDAARAVKHGATLKEAAEYCWANGYLDEGGAEGERGQVMDAIQASLGTAKRTRR